MRSVGECHPLIVPNVLLLNKVTSEVSLGGFLPQCQLRVRVRELGLGLGLVG